MDRTANALNWEACKVTAGKEDQSHQRLRKNAIQKEKSRLPA